MSARVPILFDRAIRPEWIDFALEQYLKSNTEGELRKILREFLDPFVNDPVTLQKTALQLQRTVGYRSTLTRNYLEQSYIRLSEMKPDDRTPLRLEILCSSNQFFADCVNTLKKLKNSGNDFAEVKHIYERMVAIYGDRSMVHRGVRYVLQTLTSYGCVTNTNGKWHIEDRLLVDS
jgi:hypothetical protein